MELSRSLSRYVPNTPSPPHPFFFFFDQVHCKLNIYSLRLYRFIYLERNLTGRKLAAAANNNPRYVCFLKFFFFYFFYFYFYFFFYIFLRCFFCPFPFVLFFNWIFLTLPSFQTFFIS